MVRGGERSSDFIKWLKVVVICGSKVDYGINYKNIYIYIVLFIEWFDFINVYLLFKIKLFIK